MNTALREHLTRGFSLSLTHDQLRALVAIDRRRDTPVPSLTGGQLLARGLITSRTIRGSECLWLTQAGQHVVGLLAEAGLYDMYDTIDKQEMPQ